MYRKVSQGWIKHYDFVLFDLFALQFAYLIAYFIRNGAGNPYGIPLYRNMAVAIELADIAVLFFFETLKNVLKRGYYRELAVTVKHVVLVELIAVLYLFTIQAGQQFSRSVLYLTGVFYGIITYLVRMLWKTFLQKKMLAGGSRSLLIVTTKDIASTVIRNIKEHNFEMFSIKNWTSAGRMLWKHFLKKRSRNMFSWQLRRWAALWPTRMHWLILCMII